MITCKLTGEVGPPVKAHIVPRAFYDIPPQAEGPLSLLTNTTRGYPKKLPVGIYDDTIVTKQGESVFDTLDNYASKILINDVEKYEEIRDRRRTIAWHITNYDYSKLKLFSLSVLWRAHASSHPAFSKVKLGLHEANIREMILNGQPGTAEEYSVNIARWDDSGFGSVFMDPFREKYDGVNYYRVYCGKYVLYTKVDKKGSKDPMRATQLDSDRSLIVITRELRNSKEWPVMKKIARVNAR